MKFKALKYLISNNKALFWNFFLKRPVYYSFRYLKSAFFARDVRENGAILIGIKNLHEFKNLAKDENNLFLLGFSYCQKPINCPSDRFSDFCLKEECQKCLISKYMMKKNIYTMCIPTCEHLGRKIFEIKEKKIFKNILFIITACPLSISLFKDLSNMLNLKGIALPLRGKTCETFDSFLWAERGIKQSQTILSKEQQQLIDELLECREFPSDHKAKPYNSISASLEI